MDITVNMMTEAPAAPLLLRPAPPPEAANLPMLHLALEHHPLEAPHVQKVPACLQCAAVQCLPHLTSCLPASLACFLDWRLPCPQACSGHLRCLPTRQRQAPTHQHSNCRHACVRACVPLMQALDFAQSLPYHALKTNCIAVADFVVRVLTGGAVRSAPLIYDRVVGEVSVRRCCTGSQRWVSGWLGKAAS